MLRENIQDILLLNVVARERSFTRAAAQLGMSQSGVSHAIRGLEERLQVRLLTRTTRSVSLTAEGERLLGAVAPRLESRSVRTVTSMSRRDGSRMATCRSPVTVWRERSSVSQWTVPFRVTIRSRDRRSTPSATAILRAWRGVRPENFIHPNTDNPRSTKSTGSRRGELWLACRVRRSKRTRNGAALPPLGQQHLGTLRDRFLRQPAARCDPAGRRSVRAQQRAIDDGLCGRGAHPRCRGGGDVVFIITTNRSPRAEGPSSDRLIRLTPGP